MQRLMLSLIIFSILIPCGFADELKRPNMQEDEENAASLIPRQAFLSNPTLGEVRLSPDGSKISYLAPVKDVLNLWVGSVEDPEEARPVTNETDQAIYPPYYWAFTDQHILFRQDQYGDENWRIYCINLTSGEKRDLTPQRGVQAEVMAMSPKHPEEIIVGLNKRDPSFHDLYRLNIETGNLTLILENREFSGFSIDDDYRIRLAQNITPDGGWEIFRPKGDGGWEMFLKAGADDIFNTYLLTGAFGERNEVAYLVDGRSRDTAGLYALNLDSEEETLLAEDPRADFIGDYLMIHPVKKNVQAAGFRYERLHWMILDNSIADDMSRLAKLEDGELSVVSRTMDDKTWLVAYDRDDGPKHYYLYDREEGGARYLFTGNEALENQHLAKMTPVVIKSRDGLDLVSYYTLPYGSDADGDLRPEKPLPLVLWVHGGPWMRDYWGYVPYQQWLANRGYAVLSVNFRGSTGFGKNFINAGNLEWGAKVQDDLMDAVNWTVQEGIADPHRVAIMGASYGGYAALAGLTFTPEFFACGIDMMGPSNLTSFIEAIPAYWLLEGRAVAKGAGDIRTEEGRALLEERSPLNYVDKIKRPLLICQEANDPRVKQKESDQIVQAMVDRNIPVTYVLYPDEGHVFLRAENRLSFFAVAEAFLAKHLGGRLEPIGDDSNGSSITVPEGAENIPGL